MIIKSSLIHQYLASQTSHMGTNVGIVHFIEPIRRGAEGALINENYRCDWTSLLWLLAGAEAGAGDDLIVDHGYAQVGVVEVEVEGNTPHDDESD